jgi:hypothetical protein
LDVAGSANISGSLSANSISANSISASSATILGSLSAAKLIGQGAIGSVTNSNVFYTESPTRNAWTTLASTVISCPNSGKIFALGAGGNPSGDDTDDKWEWRLCIDNDCKEHGGKTDDPGYLTISHYSSVREGDYTVAMQYKVGGSGTDKARAQILLAICFTSF